MTPLAEPRSTHWPSVLVIVAAGVVAALQVGKAVIAAPMLQADLGIGLAAVGWLTGIFAVLGLLAGLPTGALVTRFGSRRVLIIGLLTATLGAASGASSAALPTLLLSRVLEGAGFLLITVAAPSILAQVSAARDRDLAFALWSCFMPVGMALAMLAGPLFEDWRSIWWSGAALALAVALLVRLVAPRAGERPAWSWRGLGRDARLVLGARQPLVLAGAFALYSMMFFALFSFLPVLLMERMQVSHGSAGLLSALATAANILGNLAAGVLLSRGARRDLLLAGASLTMGLASFGIFLPVLPDTATFVLCVLFSAVGGLIPATLLSSAPLAAPGAGLIPVVLGLIIQGNNLGQIVGPVAIGAAIQRHGWGSAAVLVGTAALLAAVLVMALDRGKARPAERAQAQ